MMDGEKEKLKQKRYNDFYMDVAKRVSEMSYAKRLKVGSVLVKDGNIISFGWNGTPSGWDNECENIDYVDENGQDYDEMISKGYTFGAVSDVAGYVRRVTKPEVLHAEQNLLMKIAKSTNSTEDADMFITHAPCLECAKLIYQSGIRKVFYRDTYRSEEGLNFLQQCKVEVNRV